jgi:hypothetical protein
MHSHLLRIGVAGLLALAAVGLSGRSQAQDLVYEEAWRVPLRSAAGISLDGQGRPWVLLVGHEPAVVRLDNTGAEVEKRRLEMPSHPPRKYLNQRELSVLPDGSFLAADLLFDAEGGYLGRYEKSGYVLSPGHGPTIYASRYDRVRQLRIDDGGVVNEIGRLGIGPDRLWFPGRVATDGQRVLVVDNGAVKVFHRDPAGTPAFLMAVDGILKPLPANHTRRAPHNDIALDTLGRLYVANGKAVAVYDSDYRPLGTAVLNRAFDNAMHLAVDTGEWVYVVSGAGTGAGVVGFRLTQHSESPATAEPMPVRTLEPTQASLGPAENVVTPWRRGQPSEGVPTGSGDRVQALVADPSQGGVFWLGTGRGLMRWAPGTDSHREWTIRDGLPGGAVSALWVDGDTNYLWMASSGGLARLALDRLEEGIETIGVGEPRATYAHGFLGAAPDAGVWFWSGEGLYAVRPEDSEAVRFSWPETPFGAVREGGNVYVTDGLRLWKIDTTTGDMTLQLTVDALFDTLADQPGEAVPRLPQMRAVALDGERGELWIGTHGHGVFRLNLDTGALDHPGFQREAACRSGPNRPLPGRVVVTPAGRFVQLARCLGRIGDEFEVRVNDIVTAGPVADRDGEVWAAVAGKLVHLGDNGLREFPLPVPSDLPAASQDASATD